MEKENNRCQRCGTCCRKGPPGLHRLDKRLYEQGTLQKGHLLTLRQGELVRDNVMDRTIRLSEEMVRIRSKSHEAACIFFDGKTSGCQIYESRPLECRVLECWDTSKIQQVYAEDRLTRADLFLPDSALGQIADAHEHHCSYARVAELADRIRANAEPDKRDLQELAGMVVQDLGIRKSFQDKTKAGDFVLEFLFGRSLVRTLPGFGLEVRETEEGYRFLKTDAWDRHRK
ncbi:MAG: YkgJ family cysteine cluster protein [Desulfohalobiaceae bacterium]|nr:YkgJ family cysteine cluster protein [Desulfohalobiaceae bacterium]